ncbi:MAG: 3-deoxy-7-phosphoheptulonate synthase [Eubacteriales bacterium]|jgi:3-deoxy-7-phosphoheptulonate synthase|nr:3-deoxy-7-phosphoheptulonate synthase [Eubacteriales bacterium]
MIVILKPNSGDKEIEQVISSLKHYDLNFNISKGSHTTIIGLVGDTAKVDSEKLETNPVVEKIMIVSEPFKKANRKFHPEPTVIDINGRKIGGKEIAVIAGPCSVETKEQIISVAKAVKKSGAMFLRGGAFKPRTSPYSFQGLEAEGLELLKLAQEETGLPIVTEIMSPRHLEIFEQNVDVIQIGARNMQNFDLLKEVGRTKKPILLKRGLSSTIEEWLMAAEYIMAGGNNNVILCERGIRTFETYTRNTLDISAIPAVKRLSHLPVIVDPSHATGLSRMVEPLAKAAIAAGADGIIIEVHNNPEAALCDGPQSITPAQFDGLMKKLGKYAELEGRTL